MPPSPVLITAASALLSAGVPGVFGYLLLSLSAGRLSGAGVLTVVLAGGFVVALLLGTVVLLLGRSWLALGVPAWALTGLALATHLLGDWAASVQPFWLVAWLLPGVTGALVLLPPVRRWVRPGFGRAARSTS